MAHDPLKRIDWSAESLQWLEFMRQNTRKKRVIQRKNFSNPMGRNRAIDTNHIERLGGGGKMEEKSKQKHSDLWKNIEKSKILRSK